MWLLHFLWDWDMESGVVHFVYKSGNIFILLLPYFSAKDLGHKVMKIRSVERDRKGNY